MLQLVRSLGGATLIAICTLAGCVGSSDAEPSAATAIDTPTTTAPPPTTSPPPTTAPSISTTTTTTSTTTTTTEPPLPTIPPATYFAGGFPVGAYRVLGYWALLDENRKVVDSDSARSCPTVMVMPERAPMFVELDGETFPIVEQVRVDPIENGCRDGTFLVGIDISPGQYRIAPDGSGAFWARLDRSRNVVERHASDGPIYVDLDEGDFAVTFIGERIEVSDHPTAGLTAEELDAYVAATARTAWEDRSFDERAVICGAIARDDRESAVARVMRGLEDEPHAPLLAEQLYGIAVADCGD